MLKPPPITDYSVSENQGNFATASPNATLEDAEATGYQRTILRSLELFDERYIRSLNERQAEEMVAASRVYKELLRSLREYGLLRERIPVEVERSLFQFTLRNNPTEGAFLDYIRSNFPKVLLSGNYGKSKSRRHQLDREISRTGEYAPPVYVEHLPSRRPDDPDATPAQKRFLRDLGVRDEQVLSGLGKNAASDLIQKVLDERRKAGI